MRWSRVLLAIFSLLCLHGNTLQAAILAGPVTNTANGNVYYLLGPSGWVDAQVEARRLGGNLATINDASEQAWVYSRFGAHGGVDRHLWIGLYDANKHFDAAARSERMREFRWISHEAALYRNWSGIEPNDAGGTEECVHMWAATDPNAGRWNDAPANLSSLFGAPLCGVVEVTPGLTMPINPTQAADVRFVPGSSIKISQLIGDYDKHLGRPTENLTQRRHQLASTDLGVSFEHDGKTFVLFGDVPASGDRDPLAWSTDTNGEDGWSLRFTTNSNGSWKPITIPGITHAAFEVPTDGLSVGSSIYLWHTTDHSAADVMGRSVLARSDDHGQTFRLLRTFSDRHFVNVSVVEAPAEEWPGLPECDGGALLMFGSGDYRASNVRLAWQRADALEQKDSMRFYAGLDTNGLPRWSAREENAISLFNQPRVGELSVTFNPFLRRWLMLYNSDSPRGINFRTAINPWGPWSGPMVLFEPRRDKGYCHFMHVSWLDEQCDSVHDSGFENVYGGEYGAYVIERLTTGSPGKSRIYFTMSTWNPYTVVLMRADLERLAGMPAAPRVESPRVEQSRIVLEWAAPALGWFLETASSLVGSDWKRYPCRAEGLDGRLRVTLEPSGTASFLRLVRP